MDNRKSFEYYIPAGKYISIRITSAEVNELFEMDISTKQQPGRNDEIGVQILDDRNFIIWETGRKATQARSVGNSMPSYFSIASAKIAWGVLQFQSTNSGDYHIILDNSHSTFTGKHVNLVANRLPPVNHVTEPSSVEFKSGDSLGAIEQILRRFPLMIRHLQDRHDARSSLDIRDEYDLQDLLRSVLTLSFSDVRPEESTPSYAGSASRMDFLLKSEQIVIETKMTRKGLGAREVGDQLLVDIARYQVHPDCKALICFVYDPEGWISNPDGLENDLSKTDEGLQVSVIVAPKGT